MRPRRHLEPHVAAFEAAAATDVAADRIADLADAFEVLFAERTSRPAARRALERISEAADAARLAIRSSGDDWETIRFRAVIVLHRSGHPLPHALPVVITSDNDPWRSQ
jgi:hypothetical protein